MKLAMPIGKQIAMDISNENNDANSDGYCIGKSSPPSFPMTVQI